MKQLLLLLAVCFFSSSIFAQDTPKVELFGGYSYVRGDVDDDDALNLHGWNGSANFNVNKWFGIKGDFGGAYRTESGSLIYNGQVITGDVAVRLHSFLFGPQITYRTDKVDIFGHVLAGAVRLGVSGRISSAGVSVPYGDSDTTFGLAVGGGVDVKVTDHFYLRPIQADYVLTRFGGTSQNNLRLSVGVVGKIGN